MKMYFYKTIIHVLLLTNLCRSALCLYHNTSLGTLEGVQSRSRNGNKFNMFLSIPYAEPPVGDLRFQLPILYTKPWPNVRIATRDAPICIQFKLNGYHGQEDCLFLNIHTPEIINTNSRYPVVVFFHPGKREFGDMKTNHFGPHYFMDKKIIFVTAQYRLTLFGFMGANDESMPANNGLKDQSTALRWINRYIIDYGGDPTNVTILGESSSAIDASLHLFSPLSKNYFHRVITQSGQSLHYRAILTQKEYMSRTWAVAKAVGCRNRLIKSSELLLDCLQEIPASILLQSTLTLSHDYLLPYTYFGLVVERSSPTAFLVSRPNSEIMKPNDKQWLMGTTANEGIQKAIGVFYNRRNRLATKNHFCRNYKKLFPEILGFHNLPDSDDILERIKEYYFNQNPLDDTTLYGLGRALGFGTVYLPTIEAASQYNGIRYMYLYDYLNHPTHQRSYEIAHPLPKSIHLGVVHGEELRSLFYQPVLYPASYGDDKIVSQQIINLWYNFIKYGNPNGLEAKEVWKPVTTKLEYLHINNLTLTMKYFFKWDEYQFWKSLNKPTLPTTEQIEAERRLIAL